MGIKTVLMCRYPTPLTDPRIHDVGRPAEHPASGTEAHALAWIQIRDPLADNSIRSTNPSSRRNYRLESDEMDGWSGGWEQGGIKRGGGGIKCYQR